MALLIWKTLLLAVTIFELIGGQSVYNSPSYGYASDVDLQGYKFNMFMAPSSYFTSPLNFDAVPGKVVVGGKSALYLLWANMTMVQNLNMNVACTASGQIQTCPSNLVRLYSAPSANSTTVVVCASTGPLCSLVDTSSGSLTMTTGYVTSSSTLLSSDPNVPSVDIFFNLTSSRNTNLFAASGTSLTFHTLNPNDPTSLNSSLKFGFTPMNNVFNLTTWFSPLLVIVDVYKADYPMRGPLPSGYPGTPTPDEHKYLFVFVREQDPVTAVVTNKVLRLCQNDPGSVSAPNGLPFPTTLLKANISCQSSSGPIRPNLLQGVVFSRPGRYYAGGVWVELMYATFTDYSGYSPQSSICVYLANDSDAIAPNGVNNRGVFDIFRSQVYDPVSGVNVANGYVECTTSGRSDLLSQRINLIQSILQYNQDPLAILSGVVVTKMAVDQPCVLNGSSCVVQDVLFLGTNFGSVLKLTMTTTANGTLTPFVSESIKLGDSSGVRQMEINNQTGVKYLYVNTDNGIYALPLERCGRYLDCSGCVGSRDPYCVWNNLTSQCVVYTSDLNITILNQNINTGMAVGCTGSSAILSPSSTITNPIIPTTGPLIPPQSPSDLRALYLGASLGTTLPIIAILVVAMAIMCGKTYMCREGASVVAKSPPLGSPDSFSPLFKSAPVDPAASIVSGAHIYDTTPALEMGKVAPPPAGAPLYGVLEANPAPLYSSLTRASAEASKAPSLPHEYSSLNVPV